MRDAAQLTRTRSAEDLFHTYLREKSRKVCKIDHMIFLVFKYSLKQ